MRVGELERRNGELARELAQTEELHHRHCQTGPPQLPPPTQPGPASSRAPNQLCCFVEAHTSVKFQGRESLPSAQRALPPLLHNLGSIFS